MPNPLDLAIMTHDTKLVIQPEPGHAVLMLLLLLLFNPSESSGYPLLQTADIALPLTLPPPQTSLPETTQRNFTKNFTSTKIITPDLQKYQ